MLIWHNPRHDLSTLADWLAAAAGAAVVRDLTAAETALDQSGTPPLVLLSADPRSVIATALDRGTPPTEALRDWSAETEAMLGLFRRHRRLVHLVDAASARAYPEALADLLELPGDLPDVPADGSGPDPLSLVLAEHSLRADLTASLLADELAASTPDLTDGALPLPADPAAAFLSLQLSRSQLTEMTRRAETAETALNVQLRLTEAATNEMDRLQQRLEQVNAGLDSSQAQLDEVTTQLARRDNQITALSGHQQTLRAQIRDREEERAAIQAELDRVMASRSIRLTAPLRQLGDLVRRAQQRLRRGRT
ncbi:hypothetical protein [Shimia biformata]|uniref:hypothetical protein n=1 Tax=Shimia biformata TaxID=1294299 RepID=UPI001951FF5F|nr:hypothetical protein [Shimia biformata]